MPNTVRHSGQAGLIHSHMAEPTHRSHHSPSVSRIADLRVVAAPWALPSACVRIPGGGPEQGAEIGTHE